MPKVNMKDCVEFVSDSPDKTRKIGNILAREILKSSSGDKAVILGLTGDLGGGKTTLLQGFSLGLGLKEKVLSPTFVIFRRNRIGGNPVFKNFFHFDCYRIGKPEEVLSLGFKDIISNPRNIIAIEWAERLGKILPRDIVFLDFEFINKMTRKIHVCCGKGK